MPQSVILTKIEQQLSSFSAAEKKVARYVLAHPEFIPNLTTKELAQQAHASEASIVRFCRRVGVDSFRMFKLALAKELTRGKATINSASLLETNDTPHMLFQKVSSLNQAALEMSSNTLSSQEFTKAVEKLSTAKKIGFFGVGGSFTSSVDGQYKFMRLGFHSVASTDYHYMIPFITMMAPEDVLICISTSGKTREVIELATYAKEQGITVIGITSSNTSSLYKQSDIPLLIPNIEVEHRIGSIASRTSQLNLIDSLYVSVFHQIGEHLLEPFDKSRKKTEEKRL
ncbi:MurR/RpiR family transcriptional regulator [Salipaludibacillus sp. LMS25]|jgi:DNA-binding MurR/RpiR family transcriptional regulator|uniref:MurR/RpiR family transcriptional regulator n=1 Tax=Salipaludibacillus sp. LMS25 TaxID=2924031 RepID=UPI0020D02727|nr:MurR/RpiR family transcriptional regulator [Salipaludibacillus sp. LMS25]UTR13539.1 MurR/RpiR family transcriptional regulator [Salipaludibacillus sp. LMS25]